MTRQIRMVFVVGACWMILRASQGWALDDIALSEPADSSLVLEEIAPAAPALYERLGGETAIRAVVENFVSRAATDPAVNFTRQGKKRSWEATPENLETLKKHLVQFFAAVAGGPQVYEGKDMLAAHKDMEITNAEFDALAANLAASLRELGVPQTEQDELLAIVAMTRTSVVES